MRNCDIAFIEDADIKHTRVSASLGEAVLVADDNDHPDCVPDASAGAILEVETSYGRHVYLDREQTRDLIEALAPYAANRESDVVALPGDCAPSKVEVINNFAGPSAGSRAAWPTQWTVRIERLERLFEALDAKVDRAYEDGYRAGRESRGFSSKAGL